MFDEHDPILRLTSHSLDDQCFPGVNVSRTPAPAPIHPESRWQRVLAGCGGAAVTAIVMTPLDTFKIRMQEAHKRRKPYRGGPFAAFRRLTRKDGIRVLWRGLTPTMFQLIPSTAIYYVAYDEIRVLLDASPLASFAAPIAGMMARSGATSLVAPAELIRTRVMAHRGRVGQGKSLAFAMASDLAHDARANGAGVLFRGLGSTLLRDVPFAACYWTMLEVLRCSHDHMNSMEVFQHQFLSGTVAATIAVALSQPADTVKTRKQIEMVSSGRAQSTLDVVRRVVAKDGLSALYVGVGARAARTAPSSALMLASYELGKHYFGTH